MATMVINAVIGYMMQRGLGGMMWGGGQGGGIMSALSNFMGGENTSPNSDMVKHVRQTCGIQDPQEASQYTQEAVNIMNEHGNTNPGGSEFCYPISWAEGNHIQRPQDSNNHKEKKFTRRCYGKFRRLEYSVNLHESLQQF